MFPLKGDNPNRFVPMTVEQARDAVDRLDEQMPARDNLELDLQVVAEELVQLINNRSLAEIVMIDVLLSAILELAEDGVESAMMMHLLGVNPHAN